MLASRAPPSKSMVLSSKIIVIYTSHLKRSHCCLFYPLENLTKSKEDRGDQQMSP